MKVIILNFKGSSMTDLDYYEIRKVKAFKEGEKPTFKLASNQDFARYSDDELVFWQSRCKSKEEILG